ncbi:MAG TPA: DUF5818 domain-containing protein [Candidatus Polarisedimenticolia bacterium]|nr:DUF5818 domain-containing protein [Candidatus Polarisedimenticolia bacterium]
MKSRFVRVSLLLSTGLIAVQLWAGQLNQSGQQVFSGEVTDTFCAPKKSHEEMMNENKTMGRDKQTCAQKCAQMGAKYVLLDTSKGTVYELDDQGKAAAFAGQEVRVVGTLENNQLKIAHIDAGSSAVASGR